MKRSIIFAAILAALAVSFTANCNLNGKAFAETVNAYTVETEIVAPSAYLEYYKLSSPVDVAVGEDVFVVAERERIVTFKNELFSSFDLTGYSISKIAVYGDYVLFLSMSRLYSLDVTNGEVVETSVKVSNYFFIQDDVLITNPSSSVYSYRILSDELGLEFIQRATYVLENDAQKVTVTPDGSIYYFNEGKLLPFDFAYGPGNKTAENLGDMRYAAATECNIWYTTPNGLFNVDLTTGNVSRIRSSLTEEKLYNLVNPQGLCVFGGFVYVCDGTMNAVYKFDEISGEQLPFAVTDRGDAPNRIQSACDMVTADGVIYTLEADGVKIYDVVTSTFSYYSLEGFSGATRIAAANDYVFLSDSSNPYVVKRDGDKLTPVQLLSDVSDYRNVACVTSYENKFYFINNESINSEMSACVYSLDLDTLTTSFVGKFRGTGAKIVTDLFGNAYVVVYFDGGYDFYTFNVRNFNDTATVSPVLRLSAAPLGLFVDIQSNLFVLGANDELNEYSLSDGVYALKNEFTIALSENLPEQTTVKAVALIGGTDQVYFLTENCIVKATETDELSRSVETPARLAIPNDYSVEFCPSLKIITAINGAKLFIVELPDKNNHDAYFDYSAFTTENAENQYVVIAETERYYLAVNDVTSAIVRKEDAVVLSPEKVTLNKSYYVADDYGAYLYPVVSDYFAKGSFKKNDKVTARETVEFNGNTFVFVTKDGVNAYLPLTLLKPDVASNSRPSFYYTAKTR